MVVLLPGESEILDRMRWNRRGARDFKRHVWREQWKRAIWISGNFSNKFIQNDDRILKMRSALPAARSKVWGNGRASAPYPDARVNLCGRWACESPKRWKCCWTKFGRRQSCYAKSHIYETPYWRVLSNSVWQQGQWQCVDNWCVHQKWNRIWIDSAYRIALFDLMNILRFASSVSLSSFSVFPCVFIEFPFCFHFQLLHIDDLVSRTILSIRTVRKGEQRKRGIRMCRI